MSVLKRKRKASHENMCLMSNLVRDGHSWIVLGEKTKQQLQGERIAELEKYGIK